MLQITKNNSDISSAVQWKTVQLNEVLTKEVSKLQFTIYKTPATASMIPVVGDTIDVFENGTTPVELYTGSFFNDANLVSYWRMEGNSNDSKGSNNGTNTNISYSSGKFGQGAGLNGTTSQIVFGGSGLPTLQGVKTVCFWFKVPALPTVSNGSMIGFFDSNSSPSNGFQVICRTSANQNTIAVSKWGGTIIADSSFTPSVGVWYHCAVTFDGTYTSIYINGIRRMLSTVSLQSGTSACFEIGSYPGNTSEFFNGQVDDVAIFNRSLSPAEILSIFNSGLTHIFGGTCTNVEITIQGGTLLAYQISCVDWSYKLNSILVTKSYAAMDPADIVADIIANFVPAGLGFTQNHVVRGNFQVASIKFKYEQVTQALEKLAKQIGWEWYVDPAKDIHFFLVQNNPAPFNIDETTGMIEWPSLDVQIDLTNMKNSVYVVGGNYLKTLTAVTAVDVYQTDGVKTVFPLAYAYDQAGLTVTLDAVTQTVGIDQQTDPTTVQWLYSSSGRFIRSTSTVATGHTLKVFGKAQIPILAHAQNSSAIALYGENQDSVIDKQIKSVAEAQQRALAEILQFGHPVYDVKFKTLQTGLVIGQTILLNSVNLGITNYPLVIKRIDGNAYSPSKFEYQVEALGSDNVTFVDIMSRLLTQENNNADTSDNSVLEGLLVFSDAMTLSDVLSTTTSTGPYKWGAGTPIANWNFFTWA